MLFWRTVTNREYWKSLTGIEEVLEKERTNRWMQIRRGKIRGKIRGRKRQRKKNRRKIEKKENYKYRKKSLLIVK